MLNHLIEMYKVIHNTQKNFKIHISASFHTNRICKNAGSTSLSIYFEVMENAVKCDPTLALRVNSNILYQTAESCKT